VGILKTRAAKQADEAPAVVPVRKAGPDTAAIHRAEIEKLQAKRAETAARLAESAQKEEEARLAAIIANPRQRSDAKGAQGDSPIVKILKQRAADERSLSAIDAELSARGKALRADEITAGLRQLAEARDKADQMNKAEGAIFEEGAAWLQAGLELYGRYVDLIESRPSLLAGLDIRDETIAEEARKSVRPFVQPVPLDALMFVKMLYVATTDPAHLGIHDAGAVVVYPSQEEYDRRKALGEPASELARYMREPKVTPNESKPLSFGPHIVQNLPRLPDLRRLDRYATKPADTPYVASEENDRAASRGEQRSFVADARTW
jgi:hypothetical protein